MSCNCINTVNEVLATRNTRLALPLFFDGSTQRLLIETEQIERGRGKRPKSAMLSTFCPFCGVRHDDAATKRPVRAEERIGS